MASKGFGGISDRLAPLAEGLPSQMPPRAVEAPATLVAKPAAKIAPAKPASAPEPEVQLTMGLRRSLRRQLNRLAEEADMTARAFVLHALRAKGLDVLDSDLEDRRRTRA